jgi:hypothetical protein
MIQKRYTQADIQLGKGEIAIAVGTVGIFLLMLFFYLEPIQTIAIGGVLLLFVFFIWLFGRGERRQPPTFLYELRQEDILVPLHAQKNVYIPYHAIEDVYVDKSIKGNSFFRESSTQNENYFIRLVVKESHAANILAIDEEHFKEDGHKRNGKIDEKSFPIFVEGFSKKQLEKMAEEIRKNVEEVDTL